MKKHRPDNRKAPVSSGTRRAGALALGLCLLSVGTGAAAQDARTLADAYSRSFETSTSMQTKLNVVGDAARSGLAGLGPFYHRVIEYAVDNAPSIATDPLLGSVAIIAAGKIAQENYQQARVALWRLFRATEETTVRLAALDALAEVARGDSRLVLEMAGYLQMDGALLSGAGRMDQRVLLSLVAALGAIGDPGAFGALFAIRTLATSNTLAAAAERALYGLGTELAPMLADVIATGTAEERLAALRLGLSSDQVQPVAKAELAQEALRVALAAPAVRSQEGGMIRLLRSLAVRQLTDSRRSEASPLVVSHFGRSIQEYDQGEVSVAYLVEAVNALGAMGTSAAAERLDLFLEFLNGYRERGKPYDERIVVTVIDNLALLGYNAAFANLSYAKYLEYSQTVKQAVFNAIYKLKW